MTGGRQQKALAVDQRDQGDGLLFAIWRAWGSQCSGYGELTTQNLVQHWADRSSTGDYSAFELQNAHNYTSRLATRFPGMGPGVGGGYRRVPINEGRAEGV
jgi:hypothetical protein